MNPDRNLDIRVATRLNAAVYAYNSADTRYKAALARKDHRESRVLEGRRRRAAQALKLAQARATELGIEVTL